MRNERVFVFPCVVVVLKLISGLLWPIYEAPGNNLWATHLIGPSRPKTEAFKMSWKQLLWVRDRHLSCPHPWHLPQAGSHSSWLATGLAVKLCRKSREQWMWEIYAFPPWEEKILICFAIQNNGFSKHLFLSRGHCRHCNKLHHNFSGLTQHTFAVL